jgi:hypothetical protein
LRMMRSAPGMPAPTPTRVLRAEGTVPDTDLETQREVVDALFAAARDGDFDFGS